MRMNVRIQVERERYHVVIAVWKSQVKHRCASLSVLFQGVKQEIYYDLAVLRRKKTIFTWFSWKVNWCFIVETNATVAISKAKSRFINALVLTDTYHSRKCLINFKAPTESHIITTIVVAKVALISSWLQVLSRCSVLGNIKLFYSYGLFHHWASYLVKSTFKVCHVLV